VGPHGRTNRRRQRIARSALSTGLPVVTRNRSQTVRQGARMSKMSKRKAFKERLTENAKKQDVKTYSDLTDKQFVEALEKYNNRAMRRS